MKNVSMTIAPYVGGYNPPTTAPSMPKAFETNHSVTFGAQFNTEEEALKFASIMISRIRDYQNESSDRN